MSVKALVLNESRDKFLITQESNGWWELPGGGLDWGMSPQEDLPREIDEEMGVKVVNIASHPSYFLTFESNRMTHAWMANVVYETKLDSLDFIPSDECISVKFVDKNDIEGLQLTKNVQKLIEIFDKNRHIQ